MISIITKPEYLFRPKQIIRRLIRGFSKPNNSINEVTLPWGINIQINISEAIGRSIWHMGLHELIVCETLWRLISDGDICIDAGANIGQMTGLMALRVGNSGTVISFEPHPDIYKKLEYNIYGIQNTPNLHDRVKINNIALSDSSSRSTLVSPEYFEANQGVSFLCNHAENLIGNNMLVKTDKLDNYLMDIDIISVLKIDVEMHELQVIIGTHNSLSSLKIKNIIYEDYPAANTNLHDLLISYGYKIFVLSQNIFGPSIIPLEECDHNQYKSITPNYVATIQEEELINSFKLRGWKCLKN